MRENELLCPKWPTHDSLELNCNNAHLCFFSYAFLHPASLQREIINVNLNASFTSRVQVSISDDIGNGTITQSQWWRWRRTKSQTDNKTLFSLCAVFQLYKLNVCMCRWYARPSRWYRYIVRFRIIEQQLKYMLRFSKYTYYNTML